MAHEISDEMFNEIKKASIKIWKTYDDTYGYATEKIDQVRAIKNFSDNWITFYGMFDPVNQQKLLLKLKPETANFIIKEYYNS